MTDAYEPVEAEPTAQSEADRKRNIAIGVGCGCATALVLVLVLLIGIGVMGLRMFSDSGDAQHEMPYPVAPAESIPAEPSAPAG